MNAPLWAALPALLSLAAAQDHADVGNLYPFLQSHADASPFSMSFPAEARPDIDAWRSEGRAKMLELLAYSPEPTPLSPEVLDIVRKDGYTRLRVRYSVTRDRATEAFLLLPDGLDAPAPAVIAIHDHGGFYYFGKEKITETEEPPESLVRHIAESYGGRPFADELARRGFVVLVPDGFYFGSQRLDPDLLPSRFTTPLREHEPGSDAYIQAFNGMAGRHEPLVAKTVFTAGTTWPGILFHGDRVAVDYLLTRPEVDPGRIGCVGLSIGGFRSAHLFGLDPRIACGVVAGWMTTYRSLLYDHLGSHTWMIYVPRQHALLDLPDVPSLNAPRPLMVVNCLQDGLFTVEGMRAADRRLAEIYGRMGASERFRCEYYDVPHSFGIPAQDDAIAWLARWLAPRADRS